MNEKQRRFVDAYIVEAHAGKAAEAAGYSARTAYSQGQRLLKNHAVANAIDAARKAAAERAGATVEALVRQFWIIATADPRELIEHRRGCCRYCYGKNFDYQSTRGELARVRARWEAKQSKRSTDIFDERGGDGFNATKPPHPDCPECFGEGRGRVFVHDTRRFSASAALLYAGVRKTKDGIEIKMQDQFAARRALAEHLGMNKPVDGSADEDERIRHMRAALFGMDQATVGAPVS